MIYRKIVPFLLILLFRTVCSGQDSENFDLKYHWDPDTFPIVLGNEYNDIWGLVNCTGQEYALIGSTQYIHAFKLEQDTVVEIGQVEGGGLSLWRDIKTYDEVAYAVADQGEEGLLIIDLKNLEEIELYGGNLELTNRLDTSFNRAHNIFIDQPNSILYVAGSDGKSDGLIVYDLFEDPLNPKLIAEVSLPEGGYVHDLYVRDNIAYCSHGNNGYYIWDMNNPNEPLLMANIETNGYNHSSWLTEDGKYAIVAEEVPAGLPLLLIDLSELEDNQIEIVNSWSEPLLAPEHLNNTPHNPFVRGNQLFVSYYEDGVQVFDITDPLEPTRVAYYDTSPDNMAYNGTDNNWGVYPFFPSGTVIASDSEFGLFVLEPEFEYGEIVHKEISHTFIPLSYNCDTELFTFQTLEGYLDYTLFESDSIYFRGPNHVFEVPAGTYQMFINNGDCTTNSAEVEVNNIIFSPVVEPDGNINPVGNFSFCENEIFSISLNTNTSYARWFKDGEQLPLAFNNLTQLPISESGEYWAVIYNHDPGGIGIDFIGDCSVETEHLIIDIYEIQIPNIILDGEILRTEFIGEYQWYLDGMPIIGAVSQELVFGEVGDYFVEVTDLNGCVSRSEIVPVLIASLIEKTLLIDWTMGPNPTSDFIHLSFPSEDITNANVFMYNIQGQILEQVFINESNLGQLSLDLTKYSSGIYFVQFHDIKNETLQSKKNILKK